MKRAWRFVLVMAVVGLALGGWFLLKKNPRQAALHSRELATRGLADYLSQHHAGVRAIVVSNPFTQRPGLAEGIYAQEEAGLRGLRLGFGTKITLEAVVFPELKPEARQDPRAVELDITSPTPLSYLVTDDAFDKLAQEHTGCELIVSLIGLPVNLARVEVWRPRSKTRFALLFPDLRMIGGAAEVRKVVKSGKLAAFVLPKPGAPSEQEPLGKNTQVEFERRFLLVTAESVDRVIEGYPALFDGSVRSGL